MAMIKCYSCGKEVSDKDRYCPNCGTLMGIKVKRCCPKCGSSNVEEITRGTTYSSSFLEVALAGIAIPNGTFWCKDCGNKF